MSAEERLNALGISLEETDFGREDEPDVGGCLLVEAFEQGMKVMVAVRPGLVGGDRETYAEWAESRLRRFAEHGPEPDGWQKRSDGRWQLWARQQQLPSLDD
ncbi:hypothetical protein ACWDYH_31005 [Nocardia goodfellowii]